MDRYGRLAAIDSAQGGWPMAGNKEWHISPIGGLRREGAWSFDRDIVALSIIGGANLDLTDAIIAQESPTLTKFSLIGGCTIVVPPDVRVQLQSFSLLGGNKQDLTDPPAPDAPVLRIRSFSLIGGVTVKDY
jgi:hypothetical protein